MNQLATINFQGAALIAIPGATRETTLIAMKPIFDAVGAGDWRAQLKKAQRDDVLATCVSVMDTQLPGDTQVRSHAFVSLHRVNYWLNSINTSRIKDKEQRARIVAFKSECANAIDRHFEAKEKGTDTPRMTRGEVAAMLAEIVRQEVTGVVTDELSPGRLGAIMKGVIHKQVVEYEERADTKMIEFQAKVMSIVDGHDKTRYSIVGYRTANQVLKDLNVPSKGRRGLTVRCSSAMKKWAEACDRHKEVRRSQETERRLFHVDLVRDWLKAEGATIIRNHKDAATGQAVLPFVIVDNKDKDGKGH